VFALGELSMLKRIDRCARLAMMSNCRRMRGVGALSLLMAFQACGTAQERREPTVAPERQLADLFAFGKMRALRGTAEDPIGRVVLAATSRDTIVLFDGVQQNIKVYSPSGTLVRQIGQPGRGPGELSALRGGFVMKTGEIVALDRGQLSVTRFSFDGAYLGRWHLERFAAHVDGCCGDSMVVAFEIPAAHADAAVQNPYELSALTVHDAVTGRVASRIGPGLGRGEGIMSSFSSPSGMVVGRQGFVAMLGDSAVHVYDLDGLSEPVAVPIPPPYEPVKAPERPITDARAAFNWGDPQQWIVAILPLPDSGIMLKLRRRDPDGNFEYRYLGMSRSGAARFISTWSAWQIWSSDGETYFATRLRGDGDIDHSLLRPTELVR
jgi:hypothetical protein